MIERALLLKVGAAMTGLVVVAGGGVAAFALSGGLAAPTVESIQTEWGEVTDEHAVIQTTAVVDNPNPIGLPGIIEIRYTASLNDVIIAEGIKEDIGLAPGENEIELAAEVRHDTIAEWWVTHVNNDEQSELTVAQSISVFSYSTELPAQTQDVETDLIGPLTTDEPRSLTLAGREMLTIRNQTAAWGEADMETTPLTFEATLVNHHDHPIDIAGFGYNITMNDVTVGEGETDAGVRVAPGSSAPMTIDAAIDTPKMADWWATHLRNDEQSRLEIRFYAIIEDDDEEVHLPLAAMSQAVSLETDLLGDGGASVEPVDAGGEAPDFAEPTVGEPTSEWGEVTQSVSPIVTTVPVSNPNDAGPLNSLLSVELAQNTTINGFEVATGESTVSSVPPGESTITMTSEMDNSLVPEWWAAHINNGETSTVETVQTGTVDLGFTGLTLEETRMTNTFETSVLDPLNSSSRQTIETSDGQTMLISERTTATWGQATAQEAPIEVTVVVTNERSIPVTVDRISYVMRMNSVKVADDEEVVGTTLAPGETRELTFTIVVDNQQMDEWWVTHLRNDEVTQTKFSIVTTITAGGETEEIPLGFLGDDQTIETDVLGTNNDSASLARPATVALSD